MKMHLPYPPITDSLSEEWFEAAGQGRLMIQRCDDCGEAQFYPRRACSHCGSSAVRWIDAAGTGRLHTFTVVHRTPNTQFVENGPYVFAIVELDEGPRMTSNIVDVAHEDLRCDMPVGVVFPERDGDQPVMPLFTAV